MPGQKYSNIEEVTKKWRTAKFLFCIVLKKKCVMFGRGLGWPQECKKYGRLAVFRNRRQKNLPQPLRRQVMTFLPLWKSVFFLLRLLKKKKRFANVTRIAHTHTYMFTASPFFFVYVQRKARFTTFFFFSKISFARNIFVKGSSGKLRPPDNYIPIWPASRKMTPPKKGLYGSFAVSRVLVYLEQPRHVSGSCAVLALPRKGKK